MPFSSIRAAGFAAPVLGAPDRRQHITRSLLLIIVALIGLIGVSTILDTLQDRRSTAANIAAVADIVQTRRLRFALVDAESAARGYVMTNGNPEYLAPYRAATKTLEQAAAALPDGLTEFTAGEAGRPRVAVGLADLRTVWDAAVLLAADGQREPAEAALLGAHTKALTDSLRDELTSFLDQQVSSATADRIRSDVTGTALRGVNLGCVLIAMLGMMYAFRRITRAVSLGFVAKQQSDELFSMADMLQSAAGLEDTSQVLRATAATLLPGLDGALYVFNNSRDRLELSTKWGTRADAASDMIAPGACWALKRGKPHLNRAHEGALRCDHLHHDEVVLELPMAARGQLFGLLQIIAPGPGAAKKLLQAQPIAAAIGDAMSLALSSIALRDRLRNQALRDGLTGLYNRRFLEEMLGRVCADAERRRSPVSAIMIDLDHFKQLNDNNGHGAGDAALRDVAAAILSCVRSNDVVCRYGGEELVVLLPDCPLAMAVLKAEQIRGRIAEQTAAGGAAVTASLGVAAIPETSTGMADLLPVADAALYLAKQQGRDRVVAGPVRPKAQTFSLLEPASG